MALSPRAAATHKQILDAALACFARSGFAATSMRQIAREAGVTQPLVHHYFGTKDELFDAVVDEAVREYDLLQGPQWELPAGDDRFFVDGLRVLFRWTGEHRELMRLVAWARLEGRTNRNARVVEVFERVRVRFRHAAELGFVREGVDVDLALVMIDALFKGFWDRRSEYEAYPLELEDFEERFLAQSMRTLFLGLLEPEVAARLLDA